MGQVGGNWVTIKESVMNSLQIAQQIVELRRQSYMVKIEEEKKNIERRIEFLKLLSK